MKTLATCFFFLFATLAHAGSAAKIALADPNDVVAQRFLPGHDFEIGMTLSEVEAIISRKYAKWQKTENREAVKKTQDAASATFTESISLEARSQAPLSDVYRLDFTSPLSGGVVYSIIRDVKFSHLPKDRLASDEWKKTIARYWGKPYAAVGPDRDNLVQAIFFFNDAGVATARDKAFCTTIFGKMDAISRNAIEDVEEVIAGIEREGCHFFTEVRAIVGESGLLVRTGSRRTDMLSYARDLASRADR
ncbi:MULTISPECIES: hypothetical protein [unclassified Sinorhizobium]|uniref:hypothetical protein n=1 Tax=unclassified Sinorhizobium TaxID=2613772 RepID=UPI0024C2E5C1|nr:MULTISPECIES: hypothetical protein [unclassified Sinorhizobium]MDK1375208.1 hypothetical protein [Sinorhizobium sp. 6-70]MDK1478014.1 hypothetical protein [Sinorhizobium sp. 6-117]